LAAWRTSRRMSGDTLVERIGSVGEISLKDALAIARQIADAFDLAQNRVWHRTR